MTSSALERGHYRRRAWLDSHGERSKQAVELGINTLFCCRIRTLKSQKPKQTDEPDLGKVYCFLLKRPWLQEWLEQGMQMVLESVTCHLLALHSSVLDFLPPQASGGMCSTNKLHGSSRELLFPDSSSESSGLVSRWLKMGQVPKPVFVTPIAET